MRTHKFVPLPATDPKVDGRGPGRKLPSLQSGRLPKFGSCIWAYIWVSRTISKPTGLDSSVDGSLETRPPPRGLNVPNLITRYTKRPPEQLDTSGPAVQGHSKSSVIECDTGRLDRYLYTTFYRSMIVKCFFFLIRFPINTAISVEERKFSYTALLYVPLRILHRGNFVTPAGLEKTSEDPIPDAERSHNHNHKINL